MLSRDEKIRLKTLITDTVVLLCKNGLVPKLQGEFCIEGLIGISLEQDDLMLVSINEKLCGSKQRNEHSNHSSFSESDSEQVGSTSYRRKQRKRRNKNSTETSAEASPKKKSAIADIYTENSIQLHPRISTDSPTPTDSSIHQHPAIIQPGSSTFPVTTEYKLTTNTSSTSAIGGSAGGSDYLVADNSCTGDSFSQNSVKLENCNTDSDDDLVMIKEEVKTQPVIDTANSSFSLQPQMQHIVPNQSADNTLIVPQQTMISLPITGPVTTDNNQEVTPNSHKSDIPYGDVQFYRSTRKYIKVELYGYTYNLDRQGTSGADFWRCDRRTIHCKGRLKITPEKSVFLIRPHNHQPDTRKNKRQILSNQENNFQTLQKQITESYEQNKCVNIAAVSSGKKTENSFNTQEPKKVELPCIQTEGKGSLTEDKMVNELSFHGLFPMEKDCEFNKASFMASKESGENLKDVMLNRSDANDCNTMTTFQELCKVTLGNKYLAPGNTSELTFQGLSDLNTSTKYLGIDTISIGNFDSMTRMNIHGSHFVDTTPMHNMSILPSDQTATHCYNLESLLDDTTQF